MPFWYLYIHQLSRFLLRYFFDCLSLVQTDSKPGVGPLLPFCQLSLLLYRPQEDADDAEKTFKRERAGGNYGAGTKEVQARNYVTRKETERKRRELFDDGLVKFKVRQRPPARLVDELPAE